MIAIRISTRVVFLTKGHALKIPIDRRGWLQGLNEKRLWREYQNDSWFVPVVWSMGGIVCQRRAQPMNACVFDHAIRMKQRIDQFNVSNCDLFKRENWGIYNGRVVLVDYGIDECISKMYP